MLKRVLHFVFGPHTFEVVAFFLAAMGIAFALSSDRDDVVKANWFLGAAFLLALGRAAHLMLTWKATPPSRYVLSFLLFGAIGVGWVVVYDWANGKLQKLDKPLAARNASSGTAAQTPPSAPVSGPGTENAIKKIEPPHTASHPPPLIRTKAFSTIIPFTVDDFHAGIPYDSNTADPLLLTYSVLGGISDISRSPFLDQSSGKVIVPKVSDADIVRFLGRIMQYYVLRTVNELQNPVTYTNYESGKGISTDTNSPVSVPDEKEYPNEKLFKLLEKLKLTFTRNSGANDWMWKQYQMKVPSGTKIDFVEVADTGSANYIIRFERAPDLLLDFRIEPTGRNQGQGTFPKNFAPVSGRDIQETYSYVFTIHVDLHWNGDRSVGQDYVEWANGLEAGLHRKLVIP